MRKTLITLAILACANGVAAVQAQSAGRIEKVDAVAEGVDLKQVSVNANGSEYTSTGTQSHTFMIRVFAKAKGSDGVYWAAVGPESGNAHEVSAPYYFTQSAGKSDGWTVYKKSLTLNVPVQKTYWYESPVEACKTNLTKQQKKGMTLAEVMKREHKVLARARLVFSVSVDDRSNNRRNKHNLGTSSSASKEVVYPVQVLCKKGS